VSQNNRPELVAVQIRDEEHKEAWWQVEQLVADTLNVNKEELTRQEIARELAEAYTGGDSLGRWQE
jgi:antitoxin component HigA of HigAB toxin-antitoxin module